MINIYIIGCGGIGGYLIDLLPMALAGLSLDLLDPKRYDMTQLLENAGTQAIPCIADSITLVDGDAFNARNALRQGEGAGSKLERRMLTIRRKLHEMSRDSILIESWLKNLRITGYSSYIRPDNMERIIPRHPDQNLLNRAALEAFSDTLGIRAHVPVVFLCVDNKKTRYEVSKYMETFDDCLVINGGNRKTAGQVTVYERSGGEALDPNIYEVFPDVNDTADKRPDELECGAVAPQHDQIANTNALVAVWMSTVFNNWAREGLTRKVRIGDTETSVRRNEVIVDTCEYATMGVYHPKTEKSDDQKGTGEEDSGEELQTSGEPEKTPGESVRSEGDAQSGVVPAEVGQHI